MKLLQITLIITYVILKAETNSIDESQILFPNSKISSSESRQKLIVCYYPSWAVYSISAENQKTFISKNIDPNLCSHLIYAFAKVLENGTVAEGDAWADKKGKELC